MIKLGDVKPILIDQIEYGLNIKAFLDLWGGCELRSDKVSLRKISM